jgi:hypothetical protein
MKTRDLMKYAVCVVKIEIKAQDSQRWMLHKAFGPKRPEVTGDWVNCIASSFMICNALHIYFG